MGDWEISRFFDRYYFVNALVLASYALVRTSLNAPRLEAAGSMGFTREQEISFFMFVTIASKYRLSPSVDAFVDTAFLFAKTAVLVLSWYLDKRVLCWYAILYGVLFLTVRPPTHTGGATGSGMLELTGSAFKRRVRNAAHGGTAGAADAAASAAASQNEYWLVFFYASWQETSHWHSPMFERIAMRFAKARGGQAAGSAAEVAAATAAAATTVAAMTAAAAAGDDCGAAAAAAAVGAGSKARLRCARVDLARHAEVALDCNIDMSRLSKQLPSVILFHQGKEQARLPSFRPDGTVVSTLIDQRGTIAFFGLEKLFGKPLPEDGLAHKGKSGREKKKQKAK
jgi:hypothetical protein